MDFCWRPVAWLLSVLMLLWLDRCQRRLFAVRCQLYVWRDCTEHYLKVGGAWTLDVPPQSAAVQFN